MSSATRRADYEDALKRHYQNGAPPDWESRHISAYAASHPWEDWAETFAHYLHITDTLEMVRALEHSARPVGHRRSAGRPEAPQPGDEARPGPGAEFDRMLARWLVLSEASNSLNRCMGLPDLYPFVISPVTARKLAFTHDLLSRRPAETA